MGDLPALPMFSGCFCFDLELSQNAEIFWWQIERHDHLLLSNLFLNLGLLDEMRVSRRLTSIIVVLCIGFLWQHFWPTFME
jgi:hypothetical protein